MWKTQVTFELPAWCGSYEFAVRCRTSEDKIRLALDLARRNVSEGTGGPFGAAVFERATGKLIAAGVNIVVPARASIAHAEMIALTLAQRELGTHDLSGAGCELASSAEPCAMCLGAIPWSGVSRLLCSARDEDVRAAGFDEGAKPANWPEQLKWRGIEVVPEILREEGRAVLAAYRQSGGPVYNPQR